MEPELNIEDIVIAKTVKENNLKENDIICFRKGECVVTHRITKIFKTNNGFEYKTKGDNNNTEDSGTITFDLIEGKVIKKIPRLGNIVLLLQKKSLIIIIIIVFYIYLIRINKIKNKKNERRLKRIKYEKSG